jgi:hypothetical protein
MTKEATGPKTVEITLGGDTVTLKPTLDCALTLSRMNAGIYGPGTIGERLVRYDLDAYVAVVRAGLGLTGNAVKNLDELVFKAGMVNLLRPLTRFVISLGDPEGKRAEAEDDADAPLSLADAAAAADAERARAVEAEAASS